MFRCKPIPASQADVDLLRSELSGTARGLADRIDGLSDGIRDLAGKAGRMPLSVTLTRKQVDQVIARFNDPLVFPREVSQHIAENIAPHGNVFHSWQMGCHPLGFMAECEFRPDGTMRLSFSDVNGYRFWTGVFHGIES
jgi:hypothetical protein